MVGKGLMQSSMKCTYHHGTSSIVVKPVAAQESEWEVHAAHGSTTTTIVTCECAVRRQTICTSEARTYIRMCKYSIQKSMLCRI